jgi:hypothetical protein
MIRSSTWIRDFSLSRDPEFVPLLGHLSSASYHANSNASIHEPFVKYTQLLRSIVKTAIVEEGCEPRLCVRVHYVMLKSRECRP